MRAKAEKAAPMKVVGYSDRLSAKHGDTVRFMVSTELEEEYEVDVVRLIHGDDRPAGPGFKDEEIERVGSFRGERQPILRGSYVRVPNARALQEIQSFTIQAWVYPTLLDRKTQGILTRWSEGSTGYGLFLEGAILSLWLKNERGRSVKVSARRKLKPFRWYFVSATFDSKTGEATLRQQTVAACEYNEADDLVMRKTIIRGLGQNRADLLIGGYDGEKGEGRAAAGLFNGKIDGPKVFGRPLSQEELEMVAGGGKVGGSDLVAEWDFGSDTASTRIRDRSSNHLDGESVNFPVRAVTGHNWSGREQLFSRAPAEYNAIHFHEDSLGDAGWKMGFEIKIPKRWRSGIYAARLRVSGGEDYVPFFVRPEKGRPTAKVAFLVPTLSYLAYGDEQQLNRADVGKSMGVENFVYPLQPQDRYVVDNGLLSLYDYYADGSGVCYTSRNRPIVNMRPKYVMQILFSGKGAPHQFNADLQITDWLEKKGFEFDVITDEDLHQEGKELLEPYRQVITGSHPEYHTERMLDGLQAYLNGGGRVVYLGGNGFYWVTCINPENPYMVEIRRWWGTGPWLSEPGEYYCSFTGEMGGTWRNRGRHPQKVYGVGFSAQGIDTGSYYSREPDSYDRRASFIFRGISERKIGDIPSLILGRGAAGFEIDRADLKLGTPNHALILGRSSGYTNMYQHVVEEINITDDKQGGTVNPFVKAEMVYLKYPRGGGVFSTGSICFGGSLSYNNYDNDISKLLYNVVKRFSSEKPLP